MKKEKTIIGGEFEIDPLLFKYEGEFYEDGMLYSSGRAALYHILYSLQAVVKKQIIFLPDYLCESIVKIVEQVNWKIYYYRVDENLQPDLSSLLSYDLSGITILFINYFGGIDLKNTITFLKNNNPSTIIIEDNVQALFSMYTSTESDVKFSSFRKTLPVPDGGWVKVKRLVLNEAVEANTFAHYKIVGGILKKYRQFDCISDENYLQPFEKGEQLIDANLASCISQFTRRIIPNLDLQKIAKDRKRNATYLINRLKDIDIFPIIEFQEDMIPLFVPIRVSDRNKLRRLLFNENIYCPYHWPCINKELKRGYEMAEHELSLIIDQRYGLIDMDRIITVLKKYYGRIHH